MYEKQMPSNFCDFHLKIHKAQVVLWILTSIINNKCPPSPEISKEFISGHAAYLFVLNDIFNRWHSVEKIKINLSLIFKTLFKGDCIQTFKTYHSDILNIKAGGVILFIHSFSSSEVSH